MNRQRLFWLLTAALVLIGTAVWVASTRDSTQSHADRPPLLSGLRAALNEVGEIRIRKGDGLAITLKKQARGWRVAERDYSADTGRIRKLLLALGEATIRERKTSNSANYAKLGVEDATTPSATSTLVEIVAAKQTWSVLIGKQDTPRSGFARIAGQAQSALIEPLIVVDTDIKAWLDREVVNVPAKEVRSVELISTGGDSYRLIRSKPEDANLTLANLARGESLASPMAANAAADALVSLVFDDVRKRTPDAKETARAQYELADGTTLVIHGFRTDGRHFIALAGSNAAATRAADWEYEIPAWKFEQIFRPRGELLAR